MPQTADVVSAKIYPTISRAVTVRVCVCACANISSHVSSYTWLFAIAQVMLPFADLHKQCLFVCLRTENIGCKLCFITVHCLAFWQHHHTSVVHQHVNFRFSYKILAASKRYRDDGMCLDRYSVVARLQRVSPRLSQ